MTTLGEKFRMARKQRNMSQLELSTGIALPALISQIENDRIVPSQDLLEALAERLQIDPKTLDDSVQDSFDPRKALRAARLHMENGKLEEAVQLFEQIIESNLLPERRESVFQDIANCYSELGTMNKCTDAWEQIVHMGLERGDIASGVRAYYMLGNAFRRNQNEALSRLYWERATTLLERHPDVYMPMAMKLYANLARSYFSRSELSAAEYAYRIAERYARDLDAARELSAIEHGLSVVLLEFGKLDEAETWLQQATMHYTELRQTRGLNQCQINLAIIRLRRGQYQTAVDQLSVDIKSKPMREDRLRLAKAYAVRSQCYEKLGLFQEALLDAVQAEALPQEQRTEASVACLRARLLYAMGHLETAERQARVAIRAADSLQDISLMTQARTLRRLALQSNDQQAAAVNASLEMCQIATRFVRQPHEFTYLLPEK